MIRRLFRAANLAIGNDIPGRRVEVREDDRFIVSYPRSGSTWVRFLLANLISSEPVSFLNIERILPDIYQNRSRFLGRFDSPRYLKSHEPFDPRYSRVLYLVRDPRDVCVSYYNYLHKMGWVNDGISLGAFVDLFLRGEIPGGYGTWGENAGSWTGARGDSDAFMLVRYEDLLEDTLLRLTEMSRFLLIRASNSALQDAVRASRIEEMKRFEDEQAEEWLPIKGSDPRVRFIRGAGVGAWRDLLSKESGDRIYDRWSGLALSLGYSR